MEEKTVTIKKGDIFNAFEEVVKIDKSTNKLINAMPMMRVVIDILAIKIEKNLFNEEDEE